jgi:hypothetical protein
MADYLDTVLSLNPTTFHRLQDTPTASGPLVDLKSVQNMAFGATPGHTQNPFALAAYSTPPTILEFPNSQSSNNRIVGSTNSVWDRGSSDRSCSAFVWCKRATTPSVNFITLLSMGDNTTGGFSVYYNATNGRIESSHRNGGTVTGGSSVWVMDDTWHLVGWRYNPTDGWQINTDGVDRSTRINPAKWANGVIPAQFRPGTWGANAHWEGDIADAAFFNYELTNTQMLDVYTAGSTSPSSGGIGTGRFWVAVDGEWVQ